jgi:acyl carrier protein
MDDIANTVRTYILETFLPGEDPKALTDTLPLMTSGILDSLATIDLVTFLETQYAIELGANDVDATRLGTIADIATLVRSKQALKA